MSFLNLARDLYVNIYGIESLSKEREFEDDSVSNIIESYIKRLEKAYNEDGWFGIIQEEDKIKREVKK